MHPLPRFLAVALFIVLAALVSLLAVSAWRGARPAPDPTHAGTVIASSTAAPSSAASRAADRVLALSHPYALLLATVALALVIILMLGLGSWTRPAGSTRGPFEAAQTEIGTLEQLARSSVAQGEELTRERDVRRRAEEDAHLKQQLLTRSLEEKIRLGRDLHDGIIQSLYAVGMTVESARALLTSDPPEADRRLEQTRTRLNEAIRDIRAYITGLAPDHLRRAGFGQALEATLAELRAGRDTHFDIIIDDLAAAQLSPDQTIETLQIVREAVSNALRHGGASHVTIRLHEGDREVGVLIQDNGTGFDVSTRRDGGHGLGNMQARADRIGATLRITSQPGEGVRVVATLPVLSSNPV